MDSSHRLGQCDSWITLQLEFLPDFAINFERSPRRTLENAGTSLLKLAGMTCEYASWCCLFESIILFDSIRNERS